MSVAAQLVAARNNVANTTGMPLGDLTRAEAGHRDIERIQLVQQPRQSLLDPAILRREIRRAIRFYVDSE
jgi:hypothetical protein